jgi:galactitol-specific phosphotransferase system IIB component
MPGQVDLGTSTEMENAVVEIAKSSNVSREVMTEAMAEVLAKQGQVDKAIQLFIKLSFINPEKSSYFAARIEQLKGLV